MFSNNDLCAYASCAVCVTIYSTGGKFRSVSNFTELHTLTPTVMSVNVLAVFLVKKFRPFFLQGHRGRAGNLVWG